MARVKTARTTRARHKKVLKMAKGYFGAKSVRFRMANQAVMKSLNYAYIGRRLKKRDFRQLWIARINAACRENEISYSKFINGLNKAGIEVNRKMLSTIAIDDAAAFTQLVNVAKAALEGKTAPKAAKKEVKAETKDYSKMTVAELREVAKEQGVENAASMKKAELLEAIK